MNKDFTISFWIKSANNPNWAQNNSEINFPPFNINEGILVYVSKYNTDIKLYVLHPEVGYRKITANIKDYLGKDTFFALTNNDIESKLYINAVLISTIRNNTLGTIEKGDYVMVKIKNGDLQNLKIDNTLEVVIPAKVLEIGKDKIKFNFFQHNEITELQKSKILF